MEQPPSKEYVPAKPSSRNVYPKLMVVYSCDYIYTKKSKRKKKEEVPCPGMATLDAYHGPPKCHGTQEMPHTPMFMRPICLAQENNDE